MGDADNLEQDLRALREVVRDLTQRVFRLEQAAGIAVRPPVQAHPIPPSAPGPQTPETTPPEPVTPPFHTTTGVYAPNLRAGVPAPHDEADLESRIGSHWLNRIGIAAVLIGVAYFLKFAFDNNWIGAAGRVTIGLLAGIAVVV